jgi:hypothetical protein
MERATGPFRSATRRPEELDDRRHIGLNFNWNALFHSARRVAGRDGAVARTAHSSSTYSSFSHSLWTPRSSLFAIRD